MSTSPIRHALRAPGFPLPTGIEVFRLDLDTQVDAAAARRTLTAAERARADRFARTADRGRFTATRAALRGLLAERLGQQPGAVPIAADAHGKPFVDLPGERAPAFNVSHSGVHALIALGDPRTVHALGVDIEQCRAGIEVEAMLSMAFTAREGRKVREAPDPLQALYSRWAAKEALLKAVGVGVAEHLQSIGILDRGEDGRFALECAVRAWTCYEAIALDAPAGYAAALAWCAKGSA